MSFIYFSQTIVIRILFYCRICQKRLELPQGVNVLSPTFKVFTYSIWKDIIVVCTCPLNVPLFGPGEVLTVCKVTAAKAIIAYQVCNLDG